MISQLALAITAKLKLLYEEPEKGRFMSIPLGLSYSPKQLSFMTTDDKTLTPEFLSLASQFSRTMNLIPNVGAAFNSDNRYLWDVYLYVLNQTVLADVHLSDAEQQEMKKVRDLLYSAPGQESATLLEYYQYKTLFDNAENNYNNERIAAEVDSDPVVKSKWKKEREPKLKQSLEEAGRLWTVFGHKPEVDAAFARIKVLAGRSTPDIVWDECRDSLNRSEFHLAGEDSKFYYTALNPSNVAEPGSQWIPISLTRAEVESLAASASPELRAVFGADRSATQIDLDVERFTLDVAEVYIHRSWFNENILTARCWKSAPGFGLLSDGKPSPQGQLTAYTVSLLLARNIKCTLVENSAKNKEALAKMQQQNANWMLGPFAIPRIDPKVPAGSIQIRDHRVQVSQPATARSAGVVQQSAGRTPRLNNASVRARASAFPFRAAAPPASPTTHPVAIPAAQLQKFESLRSVSSGAVQLQPAKQPAIASVLPPAPTPPASLASVSDELQVLAFISKKLPLCPDPDPSLHWLD